MAAKLVKGQTLYREALRSRGPVKEREIDEFTVATVGTKYFTLVEQPGERYLLTTMKTEHGHFRLHLTEQEILDEWDRVKLARALRNVLDYNFVPLNTLRQVAELLAEQLVATKN
jgi:hypothetical protein